MFNDNKGDVIKTTLNVSPYTAQKMKFSIKDFFSKCDQIRRKLRIWSNLLKNSLMENFIFCAVSAETVFLALISRNKSDDASALGIS